jgi:hypothetical protein
MSPTRFGEYQPSIETIALSLFYVKHTVFSRMHRENVRLNNILDVDEIARFGQSFKKPDFPLTADVELHYHRCGFIFEKFSDRNIKIAQPTMLIWSCF